jgi:glucose/arabinose dehydrogenase
MSLLKYVLRLGSAIVISSAGFAQPIQLVNAFPNLTFTQPVFLTHANDGTNRIFVVQQNGLIRVFPNDSTVTTAATFLNISSRIVSGGERGLLGLAFHPNYATNGYFYVNYTQAGTGRTIVSRFRVDPGNPNLADPNSEFILLDIYQPYTNHNGGMIMFGLDNYLYIGMGDGGSAGDPANRAQNLDSLLGKMLRINVDTVTATTNYGIPLDNPLVGIPGRDEIFAWGLRNPWRFSQDQVNGELWLADVGQGSWEEVDLIQSGLNYGWRCYEGPAAYNTSGCGPPSLYTFPVKSYARVSPHCSVTGGYIYRGYRRPDLVGRYIYGDYCSGYIWKFYYVNGQLTEDELLIDAPFSISSFGVDQNGELYICEYATTGRIWRFAGTPSLVGTSQVAPINGSSHVPTPVQLRWRSAAGAINYWLDVATDQNFTSLVVRDSTLTDTVLTVGGLNLGTRYFWRLRVKNAAGWGNFSAIWNFTTAAVPGQVVLLAPPDQSNVPSQVVTVRWRGDARATTYWFEMGHDSLFGTVTHRDTAMVDTTRTISNAVLDTMYFWRVRGVSPAGYGAFSQTWRFTTHSVPPTPTLQSPCDSGRVTVDSIPFIWRSSASALRYVFVIARDAGFTQVAFIDTNVVDTLRLVGGLARPQQYFWRVRAVNQWGSSPFSVPCTFTYDFQVGVKDESTLPKEFFLHQNYPNPFNPYTQITYDIASESYVRLSVTNLLGQEISVLDDGTKRAGRYTVDFDASNLPSGVYFYKLDAQPTDGHHEAYRAVRKMVLMR